MKKDFGMKKPSQELSLFNDALDFYDRCESSGPSIDVIELDFENPKTLREQMLVELTNLKEILVNYTDDEIESLIEEEIDTFEDFIKYYIECPICGEKNHLTNLKSLFFNEKNKRYKDELIRLMKMNYSYYNKINLRLGIPCCKCFQKYFEEE